MQKLKLEIDNLVVESFSTVNGRGVPLGTVRGQSVYTENGPDCPGWTNNCGYTPECPGYGCTLQSTCKYPTAVYDECPPGWTDDEPACTVPQPQTYYCAGGGGGSAPAMC